MRAISLGGAWGVGMVIFAAACASASRVDEEPLIAQRDVDVSPRMIRCGVGYPEPTPSAGDDVVPYVRVTVPVIVAADGTVESVGTPQLIHSTADVRNLRLSSTARDQARYRAEGCLFQPALLEGVPVSARFDLRFTVPN